MPEPIVLKRSVVAAAPHLSDRVLEIAATFGLGIDDQAAHVIIPPTQLTLPAGGIVYITGPSGSGKSTLIMLIARALQERGITVLSSDSLGTAADQPLIDSIGAADFRSAVEALSLAGLGEAFLMLRRPAELSDGQRYRFALARLFNHIRTLGSTTTIAVLADEFCAPLDRLTASALCQGVRRCLDRAEHHHVLLLCGTSHDDLLEALEPEVLIYKELQPELHIAYRASNGQRPIEKAGAST